MRILFVYLYDSVPYFPIGIASMSAMLKSHGYSTSLSYISGDGNVSQLLEDIGNIEPEVVAFSSVSSFFPAVVNAAKEVKKRYPQVFTLCGGIHSTLSPECITQSDSLDAVCVGEGELALLELVEALQQGKDHTRIEGFWFKLKSSIARNGIRPLIDNLDMLPTPDREIFYSRELPGIQRERGDFMFCRGCPFSCSYCCNHALRELYRGQKYVRYRTVEKAIEELVADTTTYEFSWLVIHDDIISLNQKWFSDFFEEYAEKVKVPFVCNVRPGTCNSEMFKLLKKANCKAVAIGIESGCSYIREQVLNRAMTNDQVLETFRLAHENGLNTHSFNMVGLPYETPERFAETINLNARLGPLNSPWIYIFHPYPKTSLGDLCAKEGWIQREVGFKERLDTALDLPQFSRRHILRYFDSFPTLVKSQSRALSKEKSLYDHWIARLIAYPQLIPLIKLSGFILRLPEVGFRKSMGKLMSRIRDRR